MIYLTNFWFLHHKYVKFYANQQIFSKTSEKVRKNVKHEMLTPHGTFERYKMHRIAYFCELQPNQRVQKYFLKSLRFQTALAFTYVFF